MAGINAGEIRQIAMVGHSHGGGSIYDLCKRLQDNPGGAIENPGQFAITMTAYVDAIRNDGSLETIAETRLPPLSQNNVNLYQGPDDLTWGASVPGSVPNWHVNIALECVNNQGHNDIDDCPVVHAILTDRLNHATFGACYTLNSNYCDDGLECQ
ncbi:MAG: hypothetical protein L3K26_00485 [Candidatus Hydrogenedentes bacterium]|nr:hypothetical protein [Candidatus Hydrogenedentota bacterium]